jgi:hypothetical protein
MGDRTGRPPKREMGELVGEGGEWPGALLARRIEEGMGADDLLCSRNARPWHGRRLRLRLRLSTDQPDLGRVTLNLDLNLGLPMRRAQWKINQPPSLER